MSRNPHIPPCSTTPTDIVLPVANNDSYFKLPTHAPPPVPTAHGGHRLNDTTYMHFMPGSSNGNVLDQVPPPRPFRSPNRSPPQPRLTTESPRKPILSVSPPAPVANNPDYYQNLPESVRPSHLVQRDASRAKEYVRARHMFRARDAEELELNRGSVIEVISKDPAIGGDGAWWAGKCTDEQGHEHFGVFPADFVESDPVTAINALVGMEKKHKAIEEIHGADVTFYEGIGSGGFGRVSRALWHKHNLVVAIKVAMFSNNDDMDALLTAVRHEAHLFNMLTHRNIVQLYGVYMASPNYGLVLEHCAGGSLNHLIAKSGIPPEILFDWAIQIASGMHYLHDELPVTLVHRDLKSGNVLIKEPLPTAYKSTAGMCSTPMTPSTPSVIANLTLKITDFGLAREADHTTRMSVGGTYAWMAPEVITQSMFSKASDVWSYGVLLWELLTGEVPYKSLEPLATAWGVAKGNLHLPVPSSCPEPLKEIFDGCWHAKPADRPAFAALITQLQAIDITDDVDIDGGDFQAVQEQWKAEIKELFQEVKVKESELQDRENAILRRELELEEKTLELERLKANMGTTASTLLNELEFEERFKRLQQRPAIPKSRHKNAGYIRRLFGLSERRDSEMVISDPSNFQHRTTVLPSDDALTSPNPHGSHSNLKLISIDDHNLSADDRSLFINPSHTIDPPSVCSTLSGSATVPRNIQLNHVVVVMDPSATPVAAARNTARSSLADMLNADAGLGARKSSDTANMGTIDRIKHKLRGSAAVTADTAVERAAPTTSTPRSQSTGGTRPEHYSSVPNLVMSTAMCKTAAIYPIHPQKPRRRPPSKSDENRRPLSPQSRGRVRPVTSKTSGGIMHAPGKLAQHLAVKARTVEGERVDDDVRTPLANVMRSLKFARSKSAVEHEDDMSVSPCRRHARSSALTPILQSSLESQPSVDDDRSTDAMPAIPSITFTCDAPPRVDRCSQRRCSEPANDEHLDATPRRTPSNYSTTSQTPLLTARTGRRHTSSQSAHGASASPMAPNCHIASALGSVAIVVSAVAVSDREKLKSLVEQRQRAVCLQRSTPVDNGGASAYRPPNVGAMQIGDQQLVMNNWHSSGRGVKGGDGDTPFARSGGGSRTQTPRCITETTPPTALPSSARSSRSSTSRYNATTPVSPMDNMPASSSRRNGKTVATPHTKSYVRNSVATPDARKVSISSACIQNMRTAQPPPLMPKAAHLSTATTQQRPAVHNRHLDTLSMVPPPPPHHSQSTPTFHAAQQRSTPLHYTPPPPSMAVANPGYEHAPPNAVVNRSRESTADDVLYPERPSTLYLSESPVTPAESGIATDGSTVSSPQIRPPASADEMAAVLVQKTPPIPPRTAPPRPRAQLPTAAQWRNDVSGNRM